MILQKKMKIFGVEQILFFEKIDEFVQFSLKTEIANLVSFSVVLLLFEMNKKLAEFFQFSLKTEIANLLSLLFFSAFRDE